MINKNIQQSVRCQQNLNKGNFSWHQPDLERLSLLKKTILKECGSRGKKDDLMEEGPPGKFGWPTTKAIVLFNCKILFVKYLKLV